MPLMCAILSGLFIGGDNGWPPQANKQKSVFLKQLFSELMHDKANKPIGAVFANAFAYAALTLFYIANFVTKEEKDRNLKFALQFAKMI